uniref:Putative secreted protein n=1 Tax=Anopheles darlingi TaxID=43151 RepID=A0A2M4DA67_ANODA
MKKVLAGQLITYLLAGFRWADEADEDAHTHISGWSQPSPLRARTTQVMLTSKNTSALHLGQPDPMSSLESSSAGLDC